MVPFAGYIMPIQYSGIIAEHMAVREKAGIFDVSHMGEVIIEGKDALKNINYLLTNDYTDLRDNRIRYSLLCYEHGGAVDDLLVYRYNENKYMLVLNASNCEKDIAFMKQHLFGEVTLTDISDITGEVALQGPNSVAIMEKILGNSDSLPKRYYSFLDNVILDGSSCLISRTGYTGEDGFEIYCSSDDVVKIFSLLLEVGKDFGLLPAGLGARDTLRLEASMPLYGHELSENITPFEASLGFAVKLNKEDFLGKASLTAGSEPAKTRVGLKITGRGIAREGCIVKYGDEEIGYITSGTHLPYLDGAYAMAIIDKSSASIGTKLVIDVRNRPVEAEVVPLPFYKR
ncbi:MAG: glycine cleavage system aminomethyltransferase GcvT [Oscillospiraceae bacterium]|nr:glycine cleavage system aminomethyltransferase GcvT [Oscillospiraceae bacterium]